MRSELSELSYGYAVTEAIARRWWPTLVAAPFFPSFLGAECLLVWERRRHADMAVIMGAATRCEVVRLWQQPTGADGTPQRPPCRAFGHRSAPSQARR